MKKELEKSNLCEKLPGESKKFIRFAGCGIKSMWPIFKTEMLIYQSKANLDEEISFCKITHLSDPEIREMTVGG